MAQFITSIREELIPSHLWYKAHQIPEPKWFASRLSVVIVQSIYAKYLDENEDIVRATLTGDAPTTSEWSTILLPTQVRLILEVWQ